MPITSVGGEQSLDASPSVDYDDIVITSLADGRYAVSYTYHAANATTGYYSNLSLFLPDGTKIMPDQAWMDGSATTTASLPGGGIALAFLDQNSGGWWLDVGTNQLSNLPAPVAVTGWPADTMILAGGQDGRVLMLGLAGDKIVGQYLNADGTTFSSVFTVYQPAGGSGVDTLSALKVTGLADGTFLIGWNEHQDGDSTYATSILSDQAATVPTPGISGSGLTYHLDSVIPLQGGGYATLTEYAAGGFTEIDLDIGGTTVAAVPLTSLTVDQASVAQLADGRFIVTWHQLDPASLSDNDGAIWAQLINLDGTRNGSAFLVDQAIVGDERQPTVAALANGRFVIAWHSENAAGNTVDGVVTRTYDPLLFTAASPLGETYAGGNLGDQIYGEVGTDTLEGKGGDDVINGAGGADTLTGGTGRDTVLGGDGDDTLKTVDGDDAANEIYNGGVGTDRLILSGTDGSYDVDLGDDVVSQIENIELSNPGTSGGTAKLRMAAAQLAGIHFTDSSGSTTVATLDISLGAIHSLTLSDSDYTGFGKSGDVIIVDGTGGNDTVIGSSNSERLFGNGGADLLNGGSGNNTLDGGSGNDTLIGGIGKDSILGGAGNDSLIGGAGKDTVAAGDGNDTVLGGTGADSLDGGNQTDTVDYSDQTQKVQVTLNGATLVNVKINGLTEDKIQNFENVQGGSAGDVLTGDGANNSFRGGLGNDTMDGAGGSHDAADYSDKSQKVAVTLNGSTAVTVSVNGVAEDSIKNFENVIGGSASDSLGGDGLANRLTGNSGGDVLSGAAGNDTLVGGLGNDKLTGGANADSFLFNAATGPANIDRIIDFVHVDDTIQLENAVFTALGAGPFVASQFLAAASGHVATSATQRVIYDKSDGTLWYDDDGTGVHLAVQFATLTTKPSDVDFTDFQIV